MVKRPPITLVERKTDEPTVVLPLHPHHNLMVRMRAAAATFEIGRRIMLAEEEVGSNVWSIFRRLSTDEATEEELIALMDREIPGLGQVAKVFGTHDGAAREENIWTLLDFFMNVHMDLQQSPRKAWENRKRDDVRQTAQLYGHKKVPR